MNRLLKEFDRPKKSNRVCHADRMFKLMMQSLMSSDVGLTY